MSKITDVFVDAAGLEKIIQQNPANAFLLKSGRGKESPENPFALLHLRDQGLYFLKLTEDQQIVASATVYARKKGDPCWSPGLDISGSDTLALSQISVHAGHRGHHYSRDLLDKVFALAARNNVVLRRNGFDEDGKAHIAPIYPQMHARYPKLRILHDGHMEPITAEQPYSVAYMLNPHLQRNDI